MAERSQTTRGEQREILVVTCLGGFLFFNTFGSIGVALPTIQKQFGNSLAEIQWVALIGVVMISSLSFCFGRAGDLLGQRQLYKIGLLLYALGAGLAVFSTSLFQLLCSRGVMSVGLAMALPMSAAILASAFGPERRGGALGVFASAIAVGRATGPTLGGFLLHLWSWQAIFVMNFLVGLGAFGAVVRIFKGAGDRRKEPFDLWGALVLMIGYPALLIGLTLGAGSGWGSFRVWSWFAVAVFGFAGFLWVELHAPKPLIDMRIFKRRSLSAALSSAALGHALYNPINICAPLFLQNVLAASPLTVGFLLAILPLLTALCSPLSGRLSDRFEAGHVAVLGLGLIFAGIFWYSTLGTASSYWSAGTALALIGMGTGFFTPANQKVAFASVDSEDYGILSAMLSSFATAAGALGTTVAVALMEFRMARVGFQDPVAFASAQQFAFTALLPLAVVALVISLSARHKEFA